MADVAGVRWEPPPRQDPKAAGSLYGERRCRRRARRGSTDTRRHMIYTRRAGDTGMPEDCAGQAGVDDGRPEVAPSSLCSDGALRVLAVEDLTP